MTEVGFGGEQGVIGEVMGFDERRGRGDGILASNQNAGVININQYQQRRMF